MTGTTATTGRASLLVRVRSIPRIWMLTAVIALAAAAMASWVSGFPALESPFRVPWWALAIGFFAAELAVVHTQFNRDAHSFSMSEVPLVIALFASSPLELIVGQVIGSAIVLAVHRRQTAVKFFFNLSQFVLVSTVTVAIFRVIVAGADPHGVLGWIAAGVATLVGLAVGDVLINLAIRTTGGSLTLAEMLQVLVLSSFGTVMNTSLALVAVMVLAAAPAALPLTVIPPLVLFIAYRAYVGQRQERSRLTSLYAASRELHGAPEIEAALHTAASHARNLLTAEFAEIVLFPEGWSGTTYRTTVHAFGGSEVMVPMGVKDDLAFWKSLAAAGPALVLDPNVIRLRPDGKDVREVVASPIAGDPHPIGMILTANRVGDVARFVEADVDLLDNLAGQLSVSLKNGRLEDSLRQVTELKEELRVQALYDPLTRLANRVLFLERVEHGLRRTRRDGTMAAVLFLDLDDFKTVNDSLGHAVGDSLLTAVGKRLQETCRPGDTVARFGGDEFAVFLEEIHSEAEAKRVAERVVAALSIPVQVNDASIITQVSVGIAFGDGESDAQHLLRNADAAMYAAKRDGKGRHRVFESFMHVETMERMRLRSDLGRALERSEFFLEYQPIVGLTDGAPYGVEALIRWDHPERGRVEPAEFISFAEETGLIVPLGRWALEEACRAARQWREALSDPVDQVLVSVNLSPLQLRDSNVVDDVAEALVAGDTNPRDLLLEITESVLMHTSLEILDDLKSLGVRLAIDDFGTGYSSLSYLDRLPIDYVKIDRSFVSRLGTKSSESPLVHAVLQLGQSLGLETIVEGVESLRQLNRLRELGCTLGQGYYLGVPMGPDEVPGFLGPNHDHDSEDHEHTASSSTGLRVVR